MYLIYIMVKVKPDKYRKGQFRLAIPQYVDTPTIFTQYMQHLFFRWKRFLRCILKQWH